MFDQNIIAFRLPSGLPATSVSTVGTDTFAAVDGQEKAVYLFSDSGMFLETYETVRPYVKIAFSSAGAYLALSDCNCRCDSRRVYLLNCRFEEIGSVDLQPSADASCEDVAELMDITPIETDGRTEIHAAFRHSVRSFDLSGRQTDTVLPEDRRRLHLHYAASGTVRALHFRKNETEFVNLADQGASYLSVVPDALILRDLVPYASHDLYGLFGYRYLYNYLLPIYLNCTFLLHTNAEPEHILQNIRACS